MKRPIRIGLFAEGSTDYYFFPGIIYRTCIALIGQHAQVLKNLAPRREIVSISCLKRQGKQKALFSNKLLAAATQAQEKGVDLLCVHLDADTVERNKKVMETKMTPALNYVTDNASSQVCQCLIPLVPIYEMEAWILADKECLMKAWNIAKHSDLGIPKGSVEEISKPKECFEQIVSKHGSAAITKRERYTWLGNKVNLGQLHSLKAYQAFKKSLQQALNQYIHPHASSV